MNSAEKIKALIIIKNYQIFDIPENAIFGSKPFDSGGVNFWKRTVKPKFRNCQRNLAVKTFRSLSLKLMWIMKNNRKTQQMTNHGPWHPR